LTDIRKFYFRTADAERKYIAPTNEINEIYRSLLSEELEIIKPTIIVTLGKQSASALTDLMKDEIEAQVINLPHFSGQAQGKIKDFFNVPQEHKFRIEEQIEYYSQFIINNVN
jgi:uracil-DNA glycosylase